MSLKINVGFTQKLGQPDYGSIGASCNIECELDSNLLFQDPDAFRSQVQGIYSACNQSVHDELARHTQGSNGNGRHTRASVNGNADNGTRTNGNGNGNGHANGDRNHGAGQNRLPRPATQAQAKALLAIAKRQQFDLPRLLQERFDVDLPADLSLQQASGLIDELNASANASANGAGGRR